MRTQQMTCCVEETEEADDVALHCSFLHSGLQPSFGRVFPSSHSSGMSIGTQEPAQSAEQLDAFSFTEVLQIPFPQREGSVH